MSESLLKLVSSSDFVNHNMATIIKLMLGKRQLCSIVVTSLKFKMILALLYFNVRVDNADVTVIVLQGLSWSDTTPLVCGAMSDTIQSILGCVPVPVIVCLCACIMTISSTSCLYDVAAANVA